MIHLRGGGTSLVVEVDDGRLPQVLHWGADLGDVPEAVLAGLAQASVAPVAFQAVDAPVPLRVLPEQSTGWLGTPGLAGHRDGTAFSPAFQVSTVDATADRLAVTATDPAAGLTVVVELELVTGGLVRQRATLTN